MTKFRPPKIKKNDCEYEVKDILVLNELNKRPTLVKDPLKTFSGHSHSSIAQKNYIDFVEVVSNLRERELIRENLPIEILCHLTMPEMKVILKNISKPISGKREVLVDRIETYASDADISKNTDKSFFVITALGQEVLNKYKNVVWILENEEFIFYFSPEYIPLCGDTNKFNEYYFMKHWNVDPTKVMIDYYESKDTAVVARIYQTEKNLEKFFYYGVKKLSEGINFKLEKSKENGWFDIDLEISIFKIMDIKSVFNSLQISDENLEKILKNIYINSIKDHSLITFDTFKKILIFLLYDESQLYGELVKDLSNIIRKKFGHELDDNVLNDNVYSHHYNDSYDDEDILNILDKNITDEKNKEEMMLQLIDELSLEVIKKIQIKIDKMIIN